MAQFISQRTLKILNRLTKSETSLTELAKVLDVSKPVALKALKRLETEGLIGSKMKKTRQGRKRVYSLAPFSIVLSYDPKKKGILAFRSSYPLSLENPLLGQIPQPEFRKATEVYLNNLRTLRSRKVYSVVLFGSLTRREGTKKSDIDLLFLSHSWKKKEEALLRDALADVVHKAKIQATPHFWSIDRLKSENSHMARSIRKEGMVLFMKGMVDEVWLILKRYRNISI